MSIKQFLQVWGFTDKDKTVEEVIGSCPTAFEGGKPYSTSDNGRGWKLVDENKWQRDVHTTPPPADQRDQWQETSPGRWSKRG